MERNIKIKLNANISMEHYIYYFVYFATMIVTAIFSCLIYRSSEKSFALSESIKTRDDNREKDVKKENALIIYYDLLLGLDDLKRLYIGLEIERISINMPQRMFLSSEWIKNVALISTDKRISIYVNDIYLLYGDLLTIQAFLEKDNLFIGETEVRDQLIISVNSLASKVFNPETILKEILEYKSNNNSTAGEREKLKDRLEIVKTEKILPTSPDECKKAIIKDIISDKYIKILQTLEDITIY